MQFGQGKPPVGVVFDADVGNGIDDVLALALLYGLDGRSEARVISLSVSKSNLKAAALCEAMGRFYAGAVSGAFGAMGRTLPVGLSTTGGTPAETPILTAVLAKRNAQGEPAYAHGIHKLNDTAEPVALIRNAFTSQHDGNCIVVLLGPATNLAPVLELPGAKELIARKVRLLAVAAGAFPTGPPEPNVKSDVRAMAKVFAEWPTPIIACGAEIDAALSYPATSIEKDFAWTENHPVVDAYRAHRPMPYDAPAGPMAAVLHAVRHDQGYFKLSDPGRIAVLDDGRTTFTPSADGHHRHLVFDPAQRERIVKACIELASAKPVPRQRRGPPQQQQQQQQQPPPQKAPDKPAPPQPPQPPPPK